MHQLLLAYGGPGRTALGFTPHYSMYPEYARDTYTEWVTAERGPAPDFALTAEAVTAAIAEHRPSIVVLTSPNNPTGTALDLEVVDAAAAALAPTRGLLVVDEAYAEFRRDGVPSALTLLPAHPNLVVTRTMSKAFALAGARLGYLVADPAIVDTVRVVRLPYHLSALTQAVARTARPSARPHASPPSRRPTADDRPPEPRRPDPRRASSTHRDPVPHHPRVLGRADPRHRRHRSGRRVHLGALLRPPAHRPGHPR